MYILGLNAFHGDSSACILKDGVLIAAAEEERFLRIKHWAGFPEESIKWCLQEAGIELDDINHIAINQNPKANLIKKVLYTLSNRPSFQMLFDRYKNKKKTLKYQNSYFKKLSWELNSEVKFMRLSTILRICHLLFTYHRLMMQ